MYAKFGAEQSGITKDQYRRFIRVRLAQMFPGWTLEYIDTLSDIEINDIFAVHSAQNRLQEENRQKALADKYRSRRR